MPPLWVRFRRVFFGCTPELREKFRRDFFLFNLRRRCISAPSEIAECCVGFCIVGQVVGDVDEINVGGLTIRATTKRCGRTANHCQGKGEPCQFEFEQAVVSLWSMRLGTDCSLFCDFLFFCFITARIRRPGYAALRLDACPSWGFPP